MQLVNVLSKNHIAQRLKAAREAFAARFPLPEALWLEWLQDEVAAFKAGRTEAPELLALAGRAVKDYLSVPLELLRLQCDPVRLPCRCLPTKGQRFRSVC